MANVLPPEMRGRGFAINTMAIHVLGDAPSPLLIGIAKDRVGLRAPVLVTGLLVVVAGLVLLAGARVAAPRSARGRGARMSDLRARAGRRGAHRARGVGAGARLPRQAAGRADQGAATSRSPRPTTPPAR